MSLIRALLDELTGAPNPESPRARRNLQSIRDSCPPGLTMKPEMEILLALVIFDGYALFPNERERHTSRR